MIASFCLTLMCLSVTTVVQAWNNGDVIPVLATTLYKGQRSPTNELLQQHSPRFGVNRHVHVNSLDDGGGMEGELKILLELGHDLGWRTQWITLRSAACDIVERDDGACLHVREIHFSFSYEKNVYGRITGWDYRVEYATTRQEHIELHYTWKHLAEYDLNSAMATLCGVCGLLAVVLIYRIAMTSRDKLKMSFASEHSEVTRKDR